MQLLPPLYSQTLKISLYKIQCCPKLQNIIDFSNLIVKPRTYLETHFMAFTSVHCCSPNTISQFLWACGGPVVGLW